LQKELQRRVGAFRLEVRALWGAAKEELLGLVGQEQGQGAGQEEGEAEGQGQAALEQVWEGSGRAVLDRKGQEYLGLYKDHQVRRQREGRGLACVLLLLLLVVGFTSRSAWVFRASRRSC
jgi:hypothetical protein